MISDPYTVSWLTDLLHSFPHVDLTFKNVNSTFKPEDPRYREVLVFWAAVPVLWLLVLLLVFLMYFCYRCCQRDVEKKQRVPCLRWTMSILTFTTLAVLGIGYYGNEKARNGLIGVAEAVGDVNRTMRAIDYQVSLLETTINGSVDHSLTVMKEIFGNQDSRLVNSTMKAELERLISTCREQTFAILQQTSRVHQRTGSTAGLDLLTQALEYDLYRWIATLVYLSWMLCLCLLLLIGISASSKCTLLTFCAFGIFTLVICWMSAGLHTGVSIGVADFCVDPNQYISGIQQEGMEKNVLNYYMTCNVASQNPFKQALEAASESLRKANETVSQALSLADSLRIDRREVESYAGRVRSGLDGASSSLLTVTALVSCVTLNKDYNRALDSLCNTALPGLVFLLLCSVLTGVLFTILVTLASRAWRHFSRSVYMERDQPQPKDYETVDTEDDPFLPRPPTESGTYYSFTRQGRPPGGRDTAQRRPTPPPAYNSYDYRTEEMTPPPQRHDDNNSYRNSNA